MTIKFVQIAVDDHTLFALDRQGNIWVCPYAGKKNITTWTKLDNPIEPEKERLRLPQTTKDGDDEL